MSVNPEGQVLLNRYRLQSLLASGGMAEVYRADDLLLNRRVAIKMVHPHLAADASFLERLTREAKAIATLAHPNIVQIYDYGEDSGRPFLAMELVEGESLATLLGRQGTLSIDRSLAIARDVLAALKHVHAREMIHRDVKPQNVLLTSDGLAKLADFGISQGTAAVALTQAGEVVGSIHYLAPERLSGQPATPAADLYAVGVMLYQILTGRLPFEGDLNAAIAAQHLNREPAAPSALRPDLPNWLDQVVLRALAKHPADRYSSAAAMLDDLARHQAAAHDSPTVRVPIGLPGPSTKGEVRSGGICSKKGRLTLIYGIALGTLLLLTVLGLFLWPREWQGETDTTVQSEAPVVIATAPADIPTPTAIPPTATAVPTQAVAASGALQRIGQIEALAKSLPTTGRNGKAGRDIQKKLEEIREALVKGSTRDALQQTQELIKDVREMASDGEIDRRLADELIAQLTALAGQLR